MNPNTQAQIGQTLPNGSMHPLGVRFYSVEGRDENNHCCYLSPEFATLEQVREFAAFVADFEQYHSIFIREETSYFQKREEIERQALLAQIVTNTSTKPTAKHPA